LLSTSASNSSYGRIDALPLKRQGTPEDIGKAVVFFASDDADWVTGQSLNVDGGQVMS
jgi:NAD(P)-dependent dehydrogenase (short-subunit alcohol dehydrogenase family)